MKRFIAGMLSSVTALALSCAVPATAAAAGKANPPREYFVYFGTYTRGESKGIYRSRLDLATGRLTEAELAFTCSNPSFLAVHPNERVLYAIDESATPEKTPGRGVSALALDARSGQLTLLNEQSCGGPAPCHIAVDHTGKAVLVANYSGGSVAAIRVQPDGRLGALSSVMQHTGSSVHPRRQQAPHAHAVNVSPDNRFVFSADLGIDKVLAYKLDPATATLTPNTPTSASVPAGSGPRHMAFHPSGKFAYVINELLCTVTAFQYDAARGELIDLQMLSTLPAGEEVKPGYSTAEIAVHPNGRFVYGSNRGHNSLAVFAVDGKTGKLTPVQHQPTLGKTPRNFAIDPTGAWLLAANQDSSSVTVFRIDEKTGHLSSTGRMLSVPVPVCVVFVAVR